MLNGRDFKLVGQRALIGTSPRYRCPFPFSSAVIRVDTNSRNAPDRWYRCAYMSQLLRPNGGRVLQSDNRVVRLNASQLFVVPNLQTYYLQFDAVPWLPRTQLLIWEYRGELDPDELATLAIGI